ncbi:hypothetical protein N9F40_00595 [bacterium]|nr:hypothetical protein [bacterium]
MEPKDLRAARGCAQTADMVMVVAIFDEVVCLSNGDWTTRRRVVAGEAIAGLPIDV